MHRIKRGVLYEVQINLFKNQMLAIGLIAFGAGLLIGKIISGNIFFFAIIVIAIGVFIIWDK